MSLNSLFAFPDFTYGFAMDQVLEPVSHSVEVGIQPRKQKIAFNHCVENSESGKQ